MDYVTRQAPMHHHPLETHYDEVVDKQRPNYQGSKFQPLVGGCAQVEDEFHKVFNKIVPISLHKFFLVNSLCSLVIMNKLLWT
jgi:hypothetical protein